jgi:spore germination protein
MDRSVFLNALFLSIKRAIAICFLGIFSVVFSFPSCAPVPEIRPPHTMGAWVVYWDAERGLKELDEHGTLFNRVSFFAYELDDEGNLRYAPGFEDIKTRFLALAKKYGFSPWVTLVNDVRKDDRVSLKDTEIIRMVLDNPMLYKKHIQDIVKRVKEDGFEGLDLDYERLCDSDEEKFRGFVTELAQGLKKDGLGLNVILEPERGPSPSSGSVAVTVMAYNLHGFGSSPGPRSTPHFISKLQERGSGDARGAPDLALAVGGYCWETDGKVKQLDWVSGQRLAASAPKKGRGVFTSVPYACLENGAEIWFEDAASIREKWVAAYQAGFRNLMIWRLGGNDEHLFKLLSKYKR